MAAPTAAPMKAASLMGAASTRSGPKRAKSGARSVWTSSPRITTRGSRAIASGDGGVDRRAEFHAGHQARPSRRPRRRDPTSASASSSMRAAASAPTAECAPAPADPDGCRGPRGGPAASGRRAAPRSALAGAETPARAGERGRGHVAEQLPAVAGRGPGRPDERIAQEVAVQPGTRARRNEGPSPRRARAIASAATAATAETSTPSTSRARRPNAAARPEQVAHRSRRPIAW